MAKLLKVKQGDPITVKSLEEAMRRAQPKFKAGKGMTHAQKTDSIRMSLEKSVPHIRELAITAQAMNAQASDKPILPYEVVQIIGGTSYQGANRTPQEFLVQEFDGMGAGRVAIALERIQPGQYGKIAIDGICMLKLTRWFDSKNLNYAMAYPLSKGAIANASGEFEILHEVLIDRTESKEDQDTDPTWAVVRFVDFNAQVFKTTDGITDLGSAIGIDTGEEASGEDSDGIPVYNPLTTGDLSAVNIYGDVDADGHGKMFRSGKILARLGSGYDAGTTIGVNASDNKFTSAGTGWKVVASLGIRPSEDPGGDEWGVIEPSATAAAANFGTYSCSQAATDAQWEPDTSIQSLTLGDAWTATVDCHLAIADGSESKEVTVTVVFSSFKLSGGGGATRYKIDIAGKVQVIDMDYPSNLPQGATDTSTNTDTSKAAVGWVALTLGNGITCQANFSGTYRVQLSTDIGGTPAMVITSPFPLKINGT